MTRQVLSPIPVFFGYSVSINQCMEVTRYLNDHIAGLISEHPQRFEGLGTIPMQDAEAACHELERCMNMGLRGVEIGSNIDGRNLNHPDFFPIFEHAAKLGAAIFVHPWNMMGQNEMRDYWLPWLVGMPSESTRAICSMIFGGVFERLPSLRVLFAHGGGSFAFTHGRIAHGFDVRPDLCAVDNDKSPRAYVGRFFVDSLVHDERALRFLIDTLGIDTVCMGSDYPFVLGEHQPGKMVRETSLLNDHERAAILEHNARRWLGN